MDNEEWRAVTLAEFTAFYEVSNAGAVRSLPRVVQRRGWRKQTFPGKVLKAALSDWGYFKVWLVADFQTRKLVSVHRLVAMAFIPNPDNLPEVNHRDGVKTNNIPVNLEWCTNEQNLAHAYKTGLMRYTPTHIREEILALAGTLSQEAIGDRVGVHQGTVSRIIRGQR